MMLVGLSGKQRVGKDTVADHLVRGYHFVKMAYADKLKEIAMDVWGLSYDECYDHKTERSRFIMQQLGTEVVRSIDKNTWVDYLMRKIENSNYDRIVIVDVRFKNEAEAIFKADGRLWRVEKENTLTSGGDNHSSETSLDSYEKFTTIIHNDLTIRQLHFKVDKAMSISFPDIYK